MARPARSDSGTIAPRFQHRCVLGFAALCLGLVGMAEPLDGKDDSRPREPLNVLFLAVDDLRPELGCYGNSQVRSPNIDRLAAQGTLFLRAYCQQAMCGPSRASLLTGLRPDTTRVWDLKKHFRKTVPDAVTLPEHFKNHGYHTQSLGKVFHGSFPLEAYRYNPRFVDVRDPQSWSVPEWFGSPQYYHTAEGMAAARAKFARMSGKKGEELDAWVNYFVLTLATEAPDVPDNVLYDGQLADAAVESLRQLHDRTFFLAVGFLRPHLAFVAPKKYWDLYNLEDLELAPNATPPKDAPPLALHDSGELRSYSDIPRQGSVPNDQARQLIHGYQACVSYIDAQIGRVLDELERLGLRDRTIVCLWGDHGWHLGEHGLWGKQTNFEDATRVPLIVTAPGARAPGRATEALVELVDVYPTLADLAGLPVPAAVEGVSFARLLDDPQAPGKPAAMSQYPRGPAMGRSIRTERYRFTLWQDRKDAGRVHGIELYDHQTDPGENVNLAGRKETAAIEQRLQEQFKEAWRQ